MSKKSKKLSVESKLTFNEEGTPTFHEVNPWVLPQIINFNQTEPEYIVGTKTIYPHPYNPGPCGWTEVGPLVIPHGKAKPSNHAKAVSYEAEQNVIVLEDGTRVSLDGLTLPKELMDGRFSTSKDMKKILLNGKTIDLVQFAEELEKSFNEDARK